MAHPHHAPDAPNAHGHDVYVRGTQHIEEQASTFALFMGMAKWGSLLIAALLTFLVMWFQPAGSFFGGVIAAAVLLVAGWWFLKSGKKAQH